MNRNRSNITYSIKVASIFKVVVSTIILATAGLSYVYLKNQLQQYGEIQRRLERELTEIRTANEAVRVQITQLSSRVFLKRSWPKIRSALCQSRVIKSFALTSVTMASEMS